jgi:hypothetical protein
VSAWCGRDTLHSVHNSNGLLHLEAWLEAVWGPIAEQSRRKRGEGPCHGAFALHPLIKGLLWHEKTQCFTLRSCGDAVNMSEVC